MTTGALTTNTNATPTSTTHRPTRSPPSHRSIHTPPAADQHHPAVLPPRHQRHTGIAPHSQPSSDRDIHPLCGLRALRKLDRHPLAGTDLMPPHNIALPDT